MDLAGHGDAERSHHVEPVQQRADDDAHAEVHDGGDLDGAAKAEGNASTSCAQGHAPSDAGKELADDGGRGVGLEEGAVNLRDPKHDDEDVVKANTHGEEGYHEDDVDGGIEAQAQIQAHAAHGAENHEEEPEQTQLEPALRREAETHQSELEEDDQPQAGHHQRKLGLQDVGISVCVQILVVPVDGIPKGLYVFGLLEDHALEHTCVQVDSLTEVIGPLGVRHRPGLRELASPSTKHLPFVEK
mmetsp:Transcript_90615/g.282156  ORF Transcript_90615/g.282156 Transcript_90615/m.282156 type:complete len:244 (-) Transcript_90615:838-1569(-)